MDEHFHLTVIGDLELSRRQLIITVQELQARVVELERQLAGEETDKDTP